MQGTENFWKSPKKGYKKTSENVMLVSFFYQKLISFIISAILQ